MTSIIIFIGIGLLAGVLSGLFGIGGGIIIIPALIYFMGFSQLKAQGTSLAILLPPVGLLAFLEYYRKGNVDLKAGIIICITLLLGAMFGAKIAHYVSPYILKKGFAVLMILVALKMITDK
jgi:uncharacterized membrane protein YfcA